jgi:hypothetical protein
VDLDRTITVPHPSALTIAELDDVLDATGIDVNDPRMSVGKVLAALVTFELRRQGEAVTFDDVYQKLRIGNVKMIDEPDPTHASDDTAAPAS